MKNFIEIWSIVFGSLIVVAGFVVDPTGVVHSSVLYVFAICIVNAAALEGIDLLRVLDFFKYRKVTGDGLRVTDSHADEDEAK